MASSSRGLLLLCCCFAAHITAVGACNPSNDLFPVKIEPIHSLLWSVEYMSYSMARVNVSAGDGTGSSLSYMVSRCPDGAQSPSNTVATPIEHTVLTQTPLVAMMEVLNRSSAIVAMPDTSLVTTPSARGHFEANGVPSFGSNNWGAAIPFNQTIVDALPNSSIAVLVGFFDSSFYSWSSFSWTGAGETIVMNEVKETTPLGRAEWLKVLGLLLGEEKAANARFAAIESEYSQAKALTTNPQLTRPTAFTARYYESSGVKTWYPAGGASYVGRMINDAGAQYLLDNDDTGSTTLNETAGHALASTAEFWLNTDANWLTLDDAIDPVDPAVSYDFSDPAFASFVSVRCGNVWERTLRVGTAGNAAAAAANDALESGIVFPQLLLKDMIKIFHPELLPDYRFEYYKNVMPIPPGSTVALEPCPISDASVVPVQISTLEAQRAAALAAGSPNDKDGSENGLGGGEVVLVVCACVLATVVGGTVWSRTIGEKRLKQRLGKMDNNQLQQWLSASTDSSSGGGGAQSPSV